MMPKAKPSVMVELWSINKWLRWTGVRLALEVDILGADSPTREPTRIGLVWWGWKDLFPPAEPSDLHWDPTKPDPVEDALDPLPERPHGRGHCGHAPKCINDDEHRDERDPLGCCNCGTRKAEQEPLAAFSRDLAALQAALPPVDAQAESRLERLLVEKRKHFPGDANKVRLQARDAGQHGPAAHPSLKPASDNCQHPIKGEFGTWCKGCTACGTSSDDTDSW